MEGYRIIVKMNRNYKYIARIKCRDLTYTLGVFRHEADAYKAIHDFLDRHT